MRKHHLITISRLIARDCAFILRGNKTSKLPDEQLPDEYVSMRREENLFICHRALIKPGSVSADANHLTLSFFLVSFVSGEVAVFGLAGVASVGVVTSATSTGESPDDSCFVSSTFTSSCCGC